MSGLELEADVLVVGGGMAAAWAATSAAREHAEVILVDKGFVGTSGVTATGGTNHWWVPPDEAEREAAIERRYQASFGLGDKAWMAKIIDTTWRTLPQLAGHYRFATDGSGKTYYPGVRGPEYLRALRALALQSGVRVLDHHPAIELFLHRDGSVAGAAGYARLDRRHWQIRAGAVILATGGCAFRSGLIGSHTNTGDGHLMAAEAGAELSGMEFNAAYSISPAWISTRTLPYTGARYFDAAGNELDIPPLTAGAPHLKALAKAFAAGPVYADLHDAPAPLKSILHLIQPATLAPFERKGVKIFEDRFKVKLFGEGTVRGTGGLRVMGAHCETSVEGLYAAGDTATRETRRRRDKRRRRAERRLGFDIGRVVRARRRRVRTPPGTSCRREDKASRHGCTSPGWPGQGDRPTGNRAPRAGSDPASGKSALAYRERA